MSNEASDGEAYVDEAPDQDSGAHDSSADRTEADENLSSDPRPDNTDKTDGQPASRSEAASGPPPDEEDEVEDDSAAKQEHAARETAKAEAAADQARAEAAEQAQRLADAKIAVKAAHDAAEADQQDQAEPDNTKRPADAESADEPKDYGTEEDQDTGKHGGRQAEDEAAAAEPVSEADPERESQEGDRTTDQRDQADQVDRPEAEEGRETGEEEDEAGEGANNQTGSEKDEVVDSDTDISEAAAAAEEADDTEDRTAFEVPDDVRDLAALFGPDAAEAIVGHYEQTGSLPDILPSMAADPGTEASGDIPLTASYPKEVAELVSRYDELGQPGVGDRILDHYDNTGELPDILPTMGTNGDTANGAGQNDTGGDTNLAGQGQTGNGQADISAQGTLPFEFSDSAAGKALKQQVDAANAADAALAGVKGGDGGELISIADWIDNQRDITSSEAGAGAEGHVDNASAKGGVDGAASESEEEVDYSVDTPQGGANWPRELIMGVDYLEHELGSAGEALADAMIETYEQTGEVVFPMPTGLEERGDEYLSAEQLPLL